MVGRLLFPNTVQCKLGSILLLLAAVVVLCPIPVVSWVPPRSSNGEWEPVQVTRARLGQLYNYTPSLLHAELCRYLSEEECQAVDNSLSRHAQSHRRRLQLWSQAGNNPNLGTVRVLVLLIQFTDHTQDRTLVDRAVIETLWTTEIQQWIAENSQGAYQVEPVVVDWTLTDNTELYYSFGMQGVVPELQQAMYPALDQLDAMAGWDWTQFDSDGNGELDAVVMMHSGYDAVIADPDCQGRQALDRIYSHAFAPGSNDATWTSADGSMRLAAYAVTSTYDGLCDTEGPAKAGLTAHEYMHTLGLIDLYDADPTIARGVGSWDVMANPYGHDNSGTPGFLSAWSRQEVAWLTPETIPYDGIYTLQPAETSAQAYVIPLQDAFAAEYLLIENRQQISFDQTLWDKGLMVYHIDDAANDMENRGFPGQDGWPQNGNHYRVAVLPKDGAYDLEQNVNIGDAGDMWLPGDELGPGMGSTVFPNTDAYQGGFIVENGITLRVLTQEANDDVTFEVTGFRQAPETTPPDTVAPTIAPTTAVQTTVAPTIAPTLQATAAPTTTTITPATAAPTMGAVAATAVPTTVLQTIAPTSVATPPAQNETLPPTSFETIVPAAPPSFGQATPVPSSSGEPISSMPPTTEPLIEMAPMPPYYGEVFPIICKPKSKKSSKSSKARGKGKGDPERLKSKRSKAKSKTKGSKSGKSKSKSKAKSKSAKGRSQSEDPASEETGFLSQARFFQDVGRSRRRRRRFNRSSRSRGTTRPRRREQIDLTNWQCSESFAAFRRPSFRGIRLVPRSIPTTTDLTLRGTIATVGPRSLPTVPTLAPASAPTGRRAYGPTRRTIPTLSPN